MYDALSYIYDAECYKFTGKERDAETGLDDFGARYYASNLGRWITPDWSAREAAVPYAEFGDPASLNLYAHVRNNPLARIDADGHCDGLESCWLGVRQWASDVRNYISSTGYAKVSGGLGIGAGVKIGPFKAEVAAENKYEIKQGGEHDTKKHIDEIKAQVAVGPVRVGPQFSDEQTKIIDNKAVDNSPHEYHVQLASEASVNGVGATQSGWDVGIGASVGAILHFGFEVGVDGKQVLSDVKNVLSEAPVSPPPASTRPPVEIDPAETTFSHPGP